MKIRKDITGEVFGRLTAIRPERHESGKIKWLCRCVCGKQAVVDGSKLRSGWTTSCGCYHKERQRAPRKHGHTHFRGRSSEYGTWVNIRSRCNNPNIPEYKSYGARGIRVCPQWNKRDGFPAFLAYMGPKPTPHHSIDRIDPNGDYTEGNVRWILLADQAQNTTRNRNFTHNGQTMCASAWDRALGFTKGTVLRRIDILKWSAHKAISTPLLSGAPRASGYNRDPGCANQGVQKIDPRWWLAD